MLYLWQSLAGLAGIALALLGIWVIGLHINSKPPRTWKR